MKKRQAFTLVELLVVISIIALLMAVLVPGLSIARELARRIVCGNILKSIGQANMSYVSAWDGYFVPFGYPGRDSSGGPMTVQWLRNPDFRKYLQIDAYDDGEGVRQLTNNFEISQYTLPRKLQCPSDLNVKDPTRALGGNVLVSYGANITGLAAGDWGSQWNNLVGYKQADVRSPAEKIMYTEGVGDWWLTWSGADYLLGWDVFRFASNDDYRNKVDGGRGYGAVAYRHSEGLNILFYDAHVDYMKKERVFIHSDWNASPQRAGMWRVGR